MPDRLRVLDNARRRAEMEERRNRGSAAGTRTVGGSDMTRRQRSVATTEYLADYTVGSEPTVYSPLGFGFGAWGSTFGFKKGMTG